MRHLCQEPSASHYNPDLGLIQSFSLLVTRETFYFDCYTRTQATNSIGQNPCKHYSLTFTLYFLASLPYRIVNGRILTFHIFPNKQRFNTIQYNYNAPYNISVHRGGRGAFATPGFWAMCSRYCHSQRGQ